MGFFAALWSSAWAAAATLDVGAAQAHPNDSGVEVAVTFAAQPGDNVAGVQFDLLFSEAVAALTNVRPGPAAVDAGKSVAFNRLAAGRCRVIVAGLNQNVIADGVLAVLVFNVAAAAPNGPQPLNLDGLVMSDPNGLNVPATGNPGTLEVIGGVTDGDTCNACGCARGALDTHPPGALGNAALLAATVLIILSMAAAASRTARYRVWGVPPHTHRGQDAPAPG